MIDDPPEDAVAGAVRREKSAFVEVVQSVSGFPLDADEAGAIAWVKPVVDHPGPDEIWCADRRTCPAERVEHTARQLSALQLGIGWADPLRRDRLRLHCGGKPTDRNIQMEQIGAALAKRCRVRTIMPAISARLFASADTT
jgi:hypothetical protein